MTQPACRAPFVALLALALGLPVTASPQAPPASAESDRIIATVNGHPVRLSDVHRQLGALPLGDQLSVRQRLDHFAESVVREEILFQSAIATGFESEPQLRDEVKALVVERLIERHVKSRIRVSDEQVRAFYAENASAIRGESVRASQILLPERSQCDVLAASVRSETEFESAARERSLDRDSAARGGDLGLFMNHAGALGFETELFTMAPGEMRVFESADGCHLVRVTARHSPPLPPLVEVEARIRALLEAQQERELLEALLERARAHVQVERPTRVP